MQPASIQAVRARARKLHDASTAEERSVLDLLLAAADDAEARSGDEDTTDVDGFAQSPLGLGQALLKSLEAEDRLGNFEIQSLMSSYRQLRT